MAAHFQLSAIIKSIQNAIVSELIFNICQRLQKICLLFDYQQKKERKTKWKLWIFKLDYTFDAQAYIYAAIYAHIHTLWEFFDIASIARALEIYL